MESEQNNDDGIKTDRSVNNGKKYDYFRYYKNNQFKIKEELMKERSLSEFFRDKYKFESIGLCENVLEDFLNSKKFKIVNKMNNKRAQFEPLPVYY